MRTSEGEGGSAPGPVAKLAHHHVGHPQLVDQGAVAPAEHEALVLGRRARHGEHAARGVDHGHARPQRAVRGSGHLGQAAARLDRRRDVAERGVESAPTSRPAEPRRSLP